MVKTLEYCTGKAISLETIEQRLKESQLNFEKLSHSLKMFTLPVYWIDNLWRLLVQVRSGKFDGELTEIEKKHFLDLEQYLKNIAFTWLDTMYKDMDLISDYGLQEFVKNIGTPLDNYDWDEFEWDQTGGKLVIGEGAYRIKGHRGNYKASVDKLLDVVKEKGLMGNYNYKTSQYMVKKRSDAIHNAAQKSYKKEGVWKIGEEHVEDIIEKYVGKEGIKYNLVTKDDFNFYFDQYLDQINQS